MSRKPIQPLAAALAAAVALPCNSCKRDDGATEAGGLNPPPGAANDGPVVEEVAYKDLGYDDGLITKDGKPFTGRAVRHYPDGKLWSRYSYKEGLYDGIIEEWYENGERSALKHFKDGKQHGITHYWDEKTGEMTKMVLYENDEEIEVKEGDEIPDNLPF